MKSTGYSPVRHDTHLGKKSYDVAGARLGFDSLGY